MIPPAGEDTNEPSLVVRNRELAERPDASPDDDDDVAGPDVGDLASHEPAARVDEHVEPIDGRAVLAAVLVADLALVAAATAGRCWGGTMTRACLQPAHTLDSATQKRRSLLRTFGRVTVLL